MNEEIAELNKQILELTNKRNHFIETEREQVAAEFRGLGWLKHLRVLYREGIDPYLGTEFRLVIVKTPPFLAEHGLSVAGEILEGNEPFLYNNVRLCRSYDEFHTYEIRCSDPKRISDFIKKHELIICSWTNRNREILELHQTLWENREK
jgi:hypothetical protein